MPKSTNPLWLAAFVVAGAIDVLFWDKPPGVSFLIWIALAMGAALILSAREGKSPARAALPLGLAVLALAGVLLVRREPVTQVWAGLAALGGLMLWAATLTNGHWLRYNIWNHIAALAVLVYAAITRPFGLHKMQPQQDEAGVQPARRWQEGKAVLRGILLALPLVALLALLLASADLVFAERLDAVLDALRLERLPETLFRLTYVLFFTFIFCGVLLHAVLPRHTIHPAGNGPGVIKPFLGWTETAIVLGSVNALFLFFVALQFQYLFGGQANITAAGFTYAEYARRGFGELVWVAVISLGLILSLETAARRETPARQRGFAMLCALLIVLVLVILASAMQRLVLYEQAYSFTRLRTYTYLFIPWLGLLLLAVLALLLSRQTGRVGLALLVFGLGFGLLLAGWNVDDWIVRRNVERAVSGAELDEQYLVDLSSDALPALIEQVQRADLPAEARLKLGKVLACYQAETALEARPWQSFNLSEWRGRQALAANAGLWSGYKVYWDNHLPYLVKDGVRYDCYRLAFID